MFVSVRNKAPRLPTLRRENSTGVYRSFPGLAPPYEFREEFSQNEFKAYIK